MNTVKAISGLAKFMGMVLMKENKSNPMMDYGNYVKITSVNDGLVVSGVHTMIDTTKT